MKQKKRKILIVDDSPAFAKVIKLTLEAHPACIERRIGA